ncbi:dolichol kinase [Coemansia sp. RSA 376]|nr:dolichol kinase [Coemansia sp. RSA 376]
MTGDNCGGASRHRRQRLFYEACIPALLLTLLACRYGVPPSSNSTVLCAVALALSLSSLVLRLVWSSKDSIQPHVYRPGADDGAVWGSLLVPISVLATSVGAEAGMEAIRLHPAIVLSLDMSATFTAHYQWSRIGKTALYAEASCFIWMLWLACTVAVGYAGKSAFGDAFAAHIAVLAYWVALLAVAGAIYAVAQGDVSESTKFMLHVKRKSYHVLAALMFVPGWVYARPLLYMSFAVAAAGFVVAECMRALDLGPCSTSIDGFMRRFIDYRDAGPVVTAHFYLLLGCALPVWLGHDSVASLAGVLSLGVADTAASLVGMKLGRARWPGTTKTVEGTVAFCLSLLAAIGVVLQLKGDVGVGWYWYAQVSVVVGVLEAWTEQNDNLVVPLCMYALMQALP